VRAREMYFGFFVARIFDARGASRRRVASPRGGIVARAIESQAGATGTPRHGGGGDAEDDSMSLVSLFTHMYETTNK